MNSHPDHPDRAALPQRIAIVATLAVALLIALVLLRPAPAPEGNLANSAVGGPFALVDEAGRAVTSDSFRGAWRLMYFGFTYCPDVCPVDTAKLAQGLKGFETAHPDRAAKVQPLFITVDPERDTPAALAEFTASFHPRLLGLTGSRADVDAALKAFRIYAAKVPGATPGSYTYDHLAVIYLMDPQGRPVEFIAGQAITPAAVTAMLTRFVR